VFDQIGGLPLHPLLIHTAVLGVPVTLLLALLFAFPRTRSWARWPLALAAVGSVVAVFLARESGEALAAVVAQADPIASLIAKHAQLAGQLQIMAAVLAVLAVVNAVVVGRLGGTAEHRGSRGRDIALMALLVVVAAVTAFWVYRVGDIGAHAVWNPVGTQDYSAPGR
jgi:MFS-type transporter involved in bile tolerance (Atg22 family)